MYDNEITYIYFKNPERKLVDYLGKYFSFNEDSMLADFSRLYTLNKKKIIFNIIIAIKKNKIVGWAIVSENLAKHRRCFNYKDIFDKNSLLLMIYIKKDFRKLGIASEFFRRLRGENKNKILVVISHDKASFGFFNKMKIYYKKIKIINWI